MSLVTVNVNIKLNHQLLDQILILTVNLLQTVNLKHQLLKDQMFSFSLFKYYINPPRW